jgi:hypothetical protein
MKWLACGSPCTERYTIGGLGFVPVARTKYLTAILSDVAMGIESDWV